MPVLVVRAKQSPIACQEHLGSALVSSSEYWSTIILIYIIIPYVIYSHNLFPCPLLTPVK